jgi:murein tripeptide amidase MpaA
MAEWFAEGLLERLTANTAAAAAAAAGAGADADAAGVVTDTEVQQLLDTAVLYIVPNMNPDGSVRWVQ